MNGNGKMSIESPKTPGSSLRQFRFQKSSKSNPIVDSGGEAEDPPSSPVKRFNVSIDSEESESSQLFIKRKRIRRISSDSEPSSPSPKTFSSEFPDPDVIQKKLQFLTESFPEKDSMELQDLLQNSDWNVERVTSMLTSSPSPKRKKINNSKSKKKISKSGVSDSDSDGGEYANGLVYDSDSENEEFSERLTKDQIRVLDFFNTAMPHELLGIDGCSKKKVENIQELRPYSDWQDLVKKIKISRCLSTDLLNNTLIVMKAKDSITKLIDKCHQITKKMGTIVQELNEGSLELAEQPSNLNSDLKLASYQMIGLNWLVLMHKQKINGILADEMGLGKTVQAISFLAHLKEMGDEGPHLIIVPSSTMDNWRKELERWCPDLEVVNYYGNQEERKVIRTNVISNSISFDIILATYNMVVSSADDRGLFRKLDFHYVVYDEAHMLKNMTTTRYESLMRVNAARKILLTGTPLQNNLVELMSLLVFVMPDMFANKKDPLKKIFSLFPRNSDESNRSQYELDIIKHAKNIMKPFFLRRLKSEVLTDLPPKTESIEKIVMNKTQKDYYFNLVSAYQKKAQNLSALSGVKGESGIGMLMNLRKTANHPLLTRKIYDDTVIKKIAKVLKKDYSHREAEEKYIIEDLSILSDFDIHKTCLTYKCINHFKLENEVICDSGKFHKLDKIFPKLIQNGDRTLIFTQFTMVLDIMEEYLKIRGHRYLRLDGSTPVQERQTLIDEFNEDKSIFIFILSTKAGGLGINLTSANTVILHDMDFNPYNDKQAEDRCHRVGQTRPVKIIRLITEETIEEGIYEVAQEKLKLEQDITSANDSSKMKKNDVSMLLKNILKVNMTDEIIGNVDEYTQE